MVTTTRAELIESGKRVRRAFDRYMAAFDTDESFDRAQTAYYDAYDAWYIECRRQGLSFGDIEELFRSMAS